MYTNLNLSLFLLICGICQISAGPGFSRGPTLEPDAPTEMPPAPIERTEMDEVADFVDKLIKRAKSGTFIMGGMQIDVEKPLEDPDKKDPEVPKPKIQDFINLYQNVKLSIEAKDKNEIDVVCVDISPKRDGSRIKEVGYPRGKYQAGSEFATAEGVTKVEQLKSENIDLRYFITWLNAYFFYCRRIEKDDITQITIKIGEGESAQTSIFSVDVSKREGNFLTKIPAAANPLLTASPTGPSVSHLIRE